MKAASFTFNTSVYTAPRLNFSRIDIATKRMYHCATYITLLWMARTRKGHPARDIWIFTYHPSRYIVAFICAPHFPLFRYEQFRKEHSTKSWNSETDETHFEMWPRGEARRHISTRIDISDIMRQATEISVGIYIRIFHSQAFITSIFLRARVCEYALRRIVLLLNSNAVITATCGTFTLVTVITAALFY